ncbi:MAG: filamentous hemagglutinin N-terminal domain-containing protein [Methylophilales bacterium]|nr:filamentous hemagglutinin N-terminal domain-containing protein [Methylophilales bacterium]
MNTQANTKTKTHSGTNLRQKVLHIAVASCFSVVPGYALAQGATAVATSGTVSQSVNGNTLTVNTSNNAILKWPSFNILNGETVRFNIANAGAVLNRVSANGGMSQILGTLSSNGKVFLINPAGVMIGAGAKINTAGFVASSLNMMDADFKNGKMRFNADTLSAGKVTNAGQIATPNGGFVYLIAPQVENSGVISTPSGEAILAAGHSVELVDSSDPSMRVKVSAQSQDVSLSQMVVNNGGNIFSVLNSGKVSANTAVVGKNGKIQFRSADKLETTATSVIEVKGTKTLDGGHFRGFADGSGSYKGSINASGRNGGFIETSAAFLDIAGISVRGNALSSSGHGGKWLLDPYNFTIHATEASHINDALNIGGVDVTIDTGSGTFSAGCCYGGGSGTLGLGNITLAADAHILKNASGSNNLNLDADNRIDILGTIDDTAANHLTVNMHAGQNRGYGGTTLLPGVFFAASSVVNVHGDVNIETNSGNVVFNGAHITAYQIDVFNHNGNILGTGDHLLTGTNSVVLNADSNGNVGTDSNALRVDTPFLDVGLSSSTEDAFVIDTGVLDSAEIKVNNFVDLDLSAGVAAYGGIEITAQDALVHSAGNLVLDDFTIDFYGGASSEFVVAAPNISMDNSSHIRDYYGASFLGIFAQNLTLDNNSYIYGKDVAINYVKDLTEVGNSATDVATFLTFAKNGSVNINANSYIEGDRIGIITGDLNINAAGYGSSKIIANDTVDFLVARDMTINGSDSGSGHAYLQVGDEAFLTIGGQLKLNSGAGYGGAAFVDVNSQATLFMDFVRSTPAQDGILIDGVLRDGSAGSPFQSALNSSTGLFVMSDPGVIGENTFVQYHLVPTKDAAKKATTDTAKNLDKAFSDPIASTAAAANFFGGEDEESDDDGKGGKKDKKDPPKQCS